MGNYHLSLQNILDSVERRHAAPFTLKLRFSDCTVEVSSNSEDLIKKLRAYYLSFVSTDASPNIYVKAIQADPPDLRLIYQMKTPDPGKTRIKEEFVDFPGGRVVRKRLTGMIFIFGSGKNLAIGPAVENYNQVVNFINNRYMEWLLQAGFLLAHASAVEHQGKGIAIAGISGAGKSTLALRLMEMGADFISNDRILIKRNGGNGYMLGVAKHPRINPGTALNNPCIAAVIPPEDRERFNQLPQEKLWDLEHKYDVFIDEHFGKERSSLYSTLDLVVILNWRRNDEACRPHQVKLKERRDLLGAFMKPVGLFYQPEDGCEPQDFSDDAYLEAVGDCPTLEFRGGVDFQKAAEYCIQFFKKEG